MTDTKQKSVDEIYWDIHPKSLDELIMARHKACIARFHAYIERIAREELEEWQRYFNIPERLDHHCKCEGKHLVSFLREDYDRIVHNLETRLAELTPNNT